MIIYRLSVQTHMYRYYYYPTKKAAVEARRAIRAEEEPGSIHDDDIEPIEFRPTRAGVAGLLNEFISSICLNEG